MERPNEPQHDIVFWSRRWIEDTPPEQFVEIQGEAPLREAIGTSAMWVNDQLVPEASPYLPGRPARHCVHFGEVELLGHAYAIGEIPLSVVESSMSVLLRPEADLGPEGAHLESIRRLAGLLFRRGGASLRPMPFRAKDESLRFSNGRFDAFGMGEPGQIDGGVTGGKVYFLLNKLVPGSKSFGLAPPQGWLGPALRAVWDAKGAAR